jgi:uncharacterized protein YprB with RNaseH-like and TPR domain
MAKIRRICWDIETDPFSQDFQQTRSFHERTKLAPTMHVACVYREETKKYEFFLPEQASALIARLCEADETVSFNGKAFDLLVLQRHHGLSAEAAARINARHFDLCVEIERQTGRRSSLDRLARASGRTQGNQWPRHR